jgi:hypothetical protein
MKRIKKNVMQKIGTKLALFICMIAIGLFTVFASINTYEVITHNDIPFSSVITTNAITNDPKTDADFREHFSKSYKEGSFGVPKKMKLPENRQHIDIIDASISESGWQASKGLAQVFIANDAEQKIFGEAIIYLRYNTPTTKHLGEVLSGDVVNIVTTEGWQLGYQVFQTASDPSSLNRTLRSNTSRIVVILIDDATGTLKCFQASLLKVGERI